MLVASWSPDPGAAGVAARLTSASHPGHLGWGMGAASELENIQGPKFRPPTRGSPLLPGSTHAAKSTHFNQKGAPKAERPAHGCLWLCRDITGTLSPALGPCPGVTPDTRQGPSACCTLAGQPQPCARCRPGTSYTWASKGHRSLHRSGGRPGSPRRAGS